MVREAEQATNEDRERNREGEASIDEGKPRAAQEEVAPLPLVGLGEVTAESLLLALGEAQGVDGASAISSFREGSRHGGVTGTFSAVALGRSGEVPPGAEDEERRPGQTDESHDRQGGDDGHDGHDEGHDRHQ